MVTFTQLRSPALPRGLALTHLFELGRALVTSLSEQVPGPAGVSLLVCSVNAFCPRARHCGVPAWRGRFAAHVPSTWEDGSTQNIGITARATPCRGQQLCHPQHYPGALGREKGLLQTSPSPADPGTCSLAGGTSCVGLGLKSGCQ